jgi:hypothetical protein
VGIHDTKKGSLLAKNFGVSYNLGTYLYKEEEVSEETRMRRESYSSFSLSAINLSNL